MAAGVEVKVTKVPSRRALVGREMPLRSASAINAFTSTRVCFHCVDSANGLF